MKNKNTIYLIVGIIAVAAIGTAIFLSKKDAPKGSFKTYLGDTSTGGSKEEPVKVVSLTEDELISRGYDLSGLYSEPFVWQSEESRGIYTDEMTF